MSVQQALSMAAEQIARFGTMPPQELIALRVDYLTRCLLVGERTSELVCANLGMVAQAEVAFSV